VRLRHLAPFDERGEAEAVLEIVRGLRAESPQASIAVLVSARTHAAPIARALRAGGVAVQGVDLIPLAEVPAVQDLMSLTRALLDPVDRAACLGVLRAPWCGLPLAALAGLFEGAPQATLGELLDDELRRARFDADSLARVQQVEATLDGARRQLGRAPLAAVVETAWLELGGAVAYAEPAAALDARRFLDAFAEREQSGEWEGVGDLGPLVARLFAASDTGAADAVQVMTVHRAKGLEFDAVILPSLGRARRRGEEPLLSYVEWPDEAQGAQLLLAPIRAPESDESTPLGAWIRALHECRADRERVRLLYVAATRARAALYLLGSLESSARGGIPAPRPGSLLASLWPAIGLGFPAEPEGGAGSSAAAAPEAAATSMRVAAPWRRPQLEALAVGSDALAVATAELPPSAEAALRAGPMTRHVGLVVHDELCRLAGRLADPGVADAAADRERWRRLLAAQGVGAAELDALTARVAEVLGRVVADPRGRWLLDPRHRDARDAVALSGLYEGRFTSVRIDRSFIDEEGSRWLVDYRISPHEGGDVDAFVAAELRACESRLRRHAALARALGAEPIRAALYFPLLPRLVEFELRR
jgi:ATP-dependent exoDNAse (exonuclease V) beta subunit